MLCSLSPASAYKLSEGVRPHCHPRPRPAWLTWSSTRLSRKLPGRGGALPLPCQPTSSSANVPRATSHLHSPEEALRWAASRGSGDHAWRVGGSVRKPWSASLPRLSRPLENCPLALCPWCRGCPPLSWGLHREHMDALECRISTRREPGRDADQHCCHVRSGPFSGPGPPLEPRSCRVCELGESLTRRIKNHQQAGTSGEGHGIADAPQGLVLPPEEAGLTVPVRPHSLYRCAERGP